MKLKRIMAMVLCFAMVLSTMGTVAFAETTEADVWDGTVDTSWYDATNPKAEYTLTTAEQFAGLAYLVNGAQTYSPAMGNNNTADFGYYCGDNYDVPKIAAPAENADSVDFEGVTIKLAADLDLRAVYATGELVLLPGNEYLTMMPIGYSIYTPFKGTFDGQGHTIKNVFQGMWDALGHPSDSYDQDIALGIFGNVENATIKNLVVDNISFNAEAVLGGVAGQVKGTSVFDTITIKNSTIASSGGWRAGGLIGDAEGKLTIKNINIDETNTVAQVGGNYDTAVGGIVAKYSDGGSIAFENCDVACKLDVYNDVVANWGYKTKVYRNCGMIIGAIGEKNEIEIDGKLYPDFDAKGLTFNNVKATFGDWANYTYCWSDAVNKGCQRIEPGVGYEGVDISNLNEYSVERIIFDALFGAENAGDLNNVRQRVDIEVAESLGVTGIEAEEYQLLGGEGTKEDPYVINNLEDLKTFRDDVNIGNTYEGKYVALKANIDLSGEVWTPIGTSVYSKEPTDDDIKMFAGNFDGGNHTITGLTSEGYVPDSSETEDNEYSFGLFGCVYGSNISNINLEDVDVDGTTRENSDGNNVDGSGVAALVGYYMPVDGKTSIIENCHVLSGTVKASNNMGGLIGFIDSNFRMPEVDITIKDCSNAADVTTDAREAGGVVGLIRSSRIDIEHISMRGNILFENCENSGDITSLGGGNPSAGGILGRDGNEDSWAKLNMVFDGCKNTGKITVYANNETHAAGIAAGHYSNGAWFVIKDSSNSGEVVVVNPENAGDVYAGGLISYGGVIELLNSTSSKAVKLGTVDGNTFIGDVANILFIDEMYGYADTVNGCTYFLNGGDAPDERKYLTDDSGNYNFYPVETASKDGFEFGYWYDNPEFTGNVYDATTTIRNGGVKVFYAKWIGPVAKLNDEDYDSLQQAFEDAKEGDTITLLDDATPALTSQRAITKASVIDLNGKTLTLTEDDLYFGTTTFKNGKIVVVPSVFASTAVIWMFENQTLTFDNVDIIATGVTGTYLIGINGGTGSAVNLLNGSSITIDNASVASLTAVICDNGTGNTVTIDDADIDVKNIEGRFYLGGTNGTIIVNNSDIDLNGVKEGFYLRAGQLLSVEGTSYVNVILNEDTTTARYGINVTDSTATYNKADTATVNATDNIPHYIAFIGTTGYETLASAIGDADIGDTIVLADNITENVTIKKSITIDGANFIYTGGISIGTGSTVEVTIKNVNFASGDGYAVTTDNIKGITIENCKATGKSLLNAKKSTPNITMKNVNVSGANYVARICYGSVAYFENVTAEQMTGYGIQTQNWGAKTITLKNCTFDTPSYVSLAVSEKGTAFDTFVFEGENTMSSLSSSEYAKYVLADNAELTAPEGSAVTARNEAYFVKYVDGTYKAVKAIAQIGDVKYASLAEALAEGGDVILLADVENASKIAVNGNVSLDLNGKTISGVCGASQDYVFMVNNGATMTIKDSSAEKTGKITYAGNNSTGWIVDVEGKLVLESGTLELTGTWGIGYAVDVRPNAWGTPYTDETSFVMNGGKIISSDGAVRVASSSADSYKNIVASFTMNNGEIEAAWDGVFVQQSNVAWDVLNVTINNGTIKSGLNPIRFYGPVATSYVNGEDCVDIQFNGGTLTYTGTEAREWLVDGILRIDGGVTADDFLKDSSVTASANFAAANKASTGYEWKTIGSVSKLFKSATSATVKAFSDTSTVKAGDTVVVKVIAEGFDFTNGDWELRYDPTMFELDSAKTTYYEDAAKGVKAQSVNSADANTLAGEIIAVGGTLQQGNEIPSGTVLATYTFTVLPQSKDTVTGKFDIVNAHINTYDYAISQTNVPAVPVDFDITITREGKVITGSLDVKQTTYNGDIQKGNAFEVSNTVVGYTDAVITYSTTENGIYTTELPTFKEAGSYSIWVQVNVDGYAEYKAEHAYMVIGAKDITLSLEVAAGAAYNKVDVKPVITGVYDAEFKGTLTISGVEGSYTKDDFIYMGKGLAIAKDARPMSVNAGSNEVTITYTQAATDNYADASTTTTVDADKAFATQTIVDDLNAAADAAVTYTYNGTEHKAQDKINAPEGWSVAVTRISDGAANPGVTNVADKEFVEIRFTHANYNDVVVSRVLKVDPLDLTIIVPDFEKGAGEPDNFTTKPVAYASDNFVASAEFGTIDELVATGNLNVSIVRKTFGEDDGIYDLTATYTPNDNYEIVVDDGKLTIGMPSDTKIEVVNNMLNGNGNSSADYVAGYKLVLVYTNTATARYTYDDKQMFDLSNAGYEYFDNAKSIADQTEDNYKYVYGIIVKAETGKDDAYYADKVDFIGTNKYVPEKIVYDADINYDDKFTNNDTSSANSVLNVEYGLDSFFMYYFLKADYDRTAEGEFKSDKMVKLFDVQEVQKFINTKTTIQ